MRVRVPDYYKNFKCIAGDCTDTCCAGWEVDVDLKAQEYYKQVQGEFGARLKESTIIDPDGIRFTLTDRKRCCFLNDSNLCDLYIALGEEHLCDTCTDFPRFSETFGELKEMGISMSCPTAAELILNHEDMLTWEEDELDEMISINDIDYDLYMQLMASRSLCFKILMDRKRGIVWRMVSVLLLANDIQKLIYKGKYKKIAKLTDKYNDEAYLDKIVLKNCKKALKHVDGTVNTESILKLFSEFEVVNDSWPDMLGKAVDCCGRVMNSDKDYIGFFKSREIQYEQMMVYFIYRYYMKAVYDEDLIAKVKLGVISIIVIRSVEKSEWKENRKLSLERLIDIAHLYSKEIEHSDENMDGISELCYGDLCFHIEALISSLL